MRLKTLAPLSVSSDSCLVLRVSTVRVTMQPPAPRPRSIREARFSSPGARTVSRIMYSSCAGSFSAGILTGIVLRIHVAQRDRLADLLGRTLLECLGTRLAGQVELGVFRNGLIVVAPVEQDGREHDENTHRPADPEHPAEEHDGHADAAAGDEGHVPLVETELVEGRVGLDLGCDQPCPEDDDRPDDQGLPWTQQKDRGVA